MRILWINDFEKISGAEKIMLTHIRYLNKKHSIGCIVPGKGELTKEIKKINNNIQLYEIGINKFNINIPKIKKHPIKSIFMIKMISKLYKSAINDFNPDVIVLNNYNITIFLFLIKNFNCKIVVYLQNHPYRKFWKILFNILFYNKKIDGVIYISKFVRDSWGFKKNKYNKIIYNGITVPKFTRNSFKNYDKTKLTFALIGQIAEWKGHEYYIKAIDIVVNKLNDSISKFYIIGRSLDENSVFASKLDRLVNKFRLNERLIFLNHIKNIFDLYKNIDVVVNLSIQEPFGLTVLEGMYFGKIVIATKNGGPSEIIEDGKSGFLVNPRDEYQIAQKMLEIISILKNDREKFLEISQEAKKRASLFSEMQMVKKVEEYLNGIINMS